MSGRASAGAPHISAVPQRSDPVIRFEPEMPEVMGLLDYWRAVREYRWSILLIVVLAAVLGVVNAISTESIYRADARVLVKFGQAALAMVATAENYQRHWMFYETQYDIIRSRAIAENVVDRLNLVERYRASRPAEPSWLAGLEEQWGRVVGWFGAEGRAGSDTDPNSESAADDAADNADARERDEAIASIIDGIGVHGGEQSEVIDISYESPSAVLAAQIVNAITDAYIEFGLDSQLTSTRQATGWLQERVAALRAQVDEAEEALRAYQERAGMVDSQSRETMIGARLGSLSTELIKAQSRRSQAEARYRQVAKTNQGKKEYRALINLLDSPLVIDGHRAHAQASTRVSELSQRYGERHPKMIAARAQQRDARTHLDNEIAKSVARLRKDYEIARAEEAELRGMIGTQKREMREVSTKASALAQLEREVAANRELYEAFVARYKEVDVASSYDVTSVRVVDVARPPTLPVSPNRVLIVAVFCVLGMLAGIALACLREFLEVHTLDRRRRSALASAGGGRRAAHRSAALEAASGGPSTPRCTTIGVLGSN